jgi:flagellar motility protein MotE (MotC chaperone)
MWRLLRDVRLIPLVLVAAGGLFILKTMGIVFDGGYTLGERLASRDRDVLIVAEEAPAPTTMIAGVPVTQPRSFSERSWAGGMYNYPDVTGSVPDAPKASPDLQLKVTDKPPPAQPGPPDAAGGADRPPSAGERAILERLGDRRQEIEARNREIDMRENLLKAAEKRVEARVAELKDMEDRVNASIKKRDEAEVARFKSLVTMYENMKAKDAARIFDRLDLRILVDVATQMNPRRLSDVLAAMTSESAEKLTVELANRAGPGSKDANGDLPKINGKPAGG